MIATIAAIRLPAFTMRVTRRNTSYIEPPARRLRATATKSAYSHDEFSVIYSMMRLFIFICDAAMSNAGRLSILCEQQETRRPK